MNPIIHAYVVLELFKEEQLSKDELDHLLVGSFFPDIEVSGFISEEVTHQKILSYFENAETKLEKCFALGMIMHGENPRCVDYYAHCEDGFIAQNVHHAKKIIKKYGSYVGKINAMTAHYLIEYSADNIIVKRNPEVLRKILSALNNPKLARSITGFSNYYQLSEKSNKRIISILKNQFLINFFENFATTETLSKSWASFNFFTSLKRGLRFREKLKQMTKFSILNFKRKLHHGKVVQMFEELNIYLEQPTLKFVYDTIEKIRPIKNELKRNIC